MNQFSHSRIQIDSNFLLRLFLAVFIVTGITGCSSTPTRADRQEQCNAHIGSKDQDPRNFKRPSDPPIVRQLQLTDNGELQDRCQWTDVLYEIQGGPDIESGKRRAKFVIFYIHGWKHNSAPNDTDLAHFTSFIAAMTEAKAGNGQDVIGVFIGWPGLSSPIVGLDNLTFWSRKSAADRVTSVGNVAKLLSAAANIRRLRNNPNDFIVAMGHSFGGRILFSSVAPILIHNQQQAHPGPDAVYNVFSGPVDLTILLNPAFEATRFSAFDNTRRVKEQYHWQQEPILLSISTTNDYATKIAYPLGQIIAGRWYDTERATVGNHQPFFTHELSYGAQTEITGFSPVHWFDSFCSGKTCLTRIAKERQGGNPFMVVTTGKELLDGHNGIWNDRFTDWLSVFIRRTEVAHRKR